jgi:hypothetical protein
LTRYPARYLPPRRFRHGYRHGAGGKEKAVGLAFGLIVVAGLSSKGAVAAVHHGSHHAAPPAVAAPVTSGSGTAFIAATLADLGAPDSQANITSMSAWFLHEYPSWPPSAANNPWDSTIQMPGSWAFNYLPGGGSVQNYPTAAEGAQATALTLGNGNYPLIVADLMSGRGLCGDASLAGEFGTWSGNGYWSVC